MKKILFTFVFCLFLTTSFSYPVLAQTSSSSNSLSNILNQLRAALNTLTAIQNQVNSVTGGTNASGTTGTGTTQNCSITVNATRLNVRSTPSVAGTLIRQYSAGQTFTTTGSVTGDNVEGSNRWWRTSDGYFVWAGGTTGGNNCSTTGGSTGSTGGTIGSSGTTGSNTSYLPTPGTGSGNCTVLSNTLSDGMRVITVPSSPSNSFSSFVVTNDNKVAPGTPVYLFSPIVDQYDGWAKVSVNGVDYPIAGPGTAPAGGFPYSTSGQNHSAANRFDIVIPNIPVPDGSDLTIKLFKADPASYGHGVANATVNDPNSPPYVVKNTFKYYSSITPPASDPVILPHAVIGQNYSAPLTPKCGGSVTWQGPFLLAGFLPRAFDISFSSGNLIYNPAGNYVTPQVGDTGSFYLLGKSGSSDVVQKFQVNVVSANTNTNTGGNTTNTGGTNTGQGPTVSMISPSTLTTAQLIFGWDINITGSGFSSGNTRVDFYQGTGLVGSATNLEISGSNIKARVPSHLGAGAYLVQVTVGNTLAGGDATKRILIVSPF